MTVDLVFAHDLHAYEYTYTWLRIQVCILNIIVYVYNAEIYIAISLVKHFSLFHSTGVTTVEGTAKPGVDYEPISTILQFEPHQLTMELDIGLIDNDDISPNAFEMFFYVNVGIVNGDGDDEPTVTATVLIKDDECKLEFTLFLDGL